MCSWNNARSMLLLLQGTPYDSVLSTDVTPIHVTVAPKPFALTSERVKSMTWKDATQLYSVRPLACCSHLCCFALAVKSKEKIDERLATESASHEDANVTQSRLSHWYSKLCHMKT